ncbi:MAG: SusD/RagB family nutrient-binding outer membrane lipoprotein, partial [Prevotella sp.]|nr:SusD/RagB family nutrient-binding outer membrane lipoprotein [Prevotella sp.]
LESTLPAGTFVKKLRYTDDELRENPNASDKTLNQNQGDGMNVRVWWDTKKYK